MKNKIKGIIFYSKIVKDNDLYIKVLSSNDIILSGMVYGGNSSKKKLIYQKGYFIDFLIQQKNENAPPVFSAEIIKPFIGIIYGDKYKLSALLSILNLINLSIIEGQYIQGLYKNIEQIIDKIIYQSHWIVYYCEWLFSLLTIIGYQVDYKNIKKIFFDLSTQQFNEFFVNNSIKFPHSLFNSDKKINYENINAVFTIFESIFFKNHLDNKNYTMIQNYLNFKKIILITLQ